MFSIFGRFLCIAFRLSFWVSFPGCSLKRPGFVAGKEIVVPLIFLLDITADNFFQSKLTGRFSFLDCILQIHSRESLQFLREMELFFLYKISDISSSGILVMERSTSSNLVSKPCTLTFFNCPLGRSLKSSRAWPVPLIVKLSWIVLAQLSSFQESIVLLCLLLYHVDSPLEVSGQQLLESTRRF